ncbi:hypothetical protein H4Q32_027552 [Labeo rohita]|uniref:Uncharacterized protein n=1 Tax=Labeo rohita TaxID=84645 RepID=A0ABQ8L6E1_LABRO|nr:hypothetical protein H4Q32_027552 [Labeo rohita]
MSASGPKKNNFLALNFTKVYKKLDLSMEGFWCGLDDDIRFIMPRGDPYWTLRDYSSFMLCLPVRIWPERLFMNCLSALWAANAAAPGEQLGSMPCSRVSIPLLSSSSASHLWIRVTAGLSVTSSIEVGGSPVSASNLRDPPGPPGSPVPLAPPWSVIDVPLTPPWSSVTPAPSRPSGSPLVPRSSEPSAPPWSSRYSLSPCLCGCLSPPWVPLPPAPPPSVSPLESSILPLSLLPPSAPPWTVSLGSGESPISSINT